jgi:hypothetical protein
VIVRWVLGVFMLSVSHITFVVIRSHVVRALLKVNSFALVPQRMILLDILDCPDICPDGKPYIIISRGVISSLLLTRHTTDHAHASRKVSYKKKTCCCPFIELPLLFFPRIGPTETADSDALKAQIVELNEHIRLLELALAEIQALVSDEPHPLLVSRSQHTQDTVNEGVDSEEFKVLVVDTPPTLSQEDSFVDAFGMPFVC